ncbi:MAG: transglutaminase domain-containing protein [Treponema sp.]|nr:transglutaminase domain-containing protein [Treponema sp.]
MKKHRIIFTVLSILTILCFAGCTAVTDFDSKIMNQEVKPVETLKNGNVSVKMFIPDYYTLTESRAIAPQTKYARLKYNTKINYDTTPPTYEWATIETLEIKEEDLFDIEGAEDVGLPGKIWKATFVLGLGTYNKLAIDLLDGDKNVITSGVNNEAVEIKENENSSCSFFTVPTEFSSKSGCLALNEMKFFSGKFLKANDVVAVMKAELGGAEVIRFNADGTFGGVMTNDFVSGKEFTITSETAGSYYGVWAKNAAVDNYEVAVCSYEITPKGVQNVISGNTIAYNLKMSFIDGTVENAVKEFTPKNTGKQTFTVEHEAINKDVEVNVLSADYLTEPITYMGNTYKGIDSSTMSGSTENVNLNSSFQQIKDISKLEVSYPTGNTFNADAFFPLKLKVNNPEMYQFMKIVISNGTNTEHYTYKGTGEDGEINTRIWLRWGPGDYTVKLYDLASVSWEYKDYDNEKNKSEDGKVTYQGDNVVVDSLYNDYPAVTFTVNNTRAEDGTWLYPSNVVQADDINIMNKAADITYGFETAYDKAKAIHDWIVLNHFYDYDSFNTPNNKKRQDAVAVMEYGMAVCEGYANLACALIRNCGIEVKFISSISMSHGWNHVNVGTADNPDWRLLDCTWDDFRGADSISWNNCLVEDLYGGYESHAATDQEASISRSISISRGHDDGTESIAY